MFFIFYFLSFNIVWLHDLDTSTWKKGLDFSFDWPLLLSKYILKHYSRIAKDGCIKCTSACLFKCSEVKCSVVPWCVCVVLLHQGFKCVFAGVIMCVCAWERGSTFIMGVSFGLCVHCAVLPQPLKIFHQHTHTHEDPWPYNTVLICYFNLFLDMCLFLRCCLRVISHSV